MTITVLRPDTPVALDRFDGWMGEESHVVALWKEPVPRLEECGDAIIMLGGRPNALDDSLPWQEPTRALLRDAVDDGRPVLGICLGHQVLARALGGEVTVAHPGGESTVPGGCGGPPRRPTTRCSLPRPHSGK